MTDRICVGAIAGAFGVQGEVRLKSFCAEAADIAAYGPLFTKDGSRSFTVRLTRPVAGGLGARLSAWPPRKRPMPCAAPSFTPTAAACPNCRMTSSIMPT